MIFDGKLTIHTYARFQAMPNQRGNIVLEIDVDDIVQQRYIFLEHGASLSDIELEVHLPDITIVGHRVNFLI